MTSATVYGRKYEHDALLREERTLAAEMFESWAFLPVSRSIFVSATVKLTLTWRARTDDNDRSLHGDGCCCDLKLKTRATFG